MTLQPSPDLFRSHQISSNPTGFLIAAHQKQHLLLLRVPHINQLKSLTDLNASLTPAMFELQSSFSGGSLFILVT